jgi:hypothetical protein
MMKAGDRIGAILKMDATTVHLIGYGTFVGNEIPDESLSGCIGEILREETEQSYGAVSAGGALRSK